MGKLSHDGSGLRRALGARAVGLREVSQVRTVGIWVSGLLASFIVGAFVGSIFDSAYSGVPAIGPPLLAFVAGFNANAFVGGIAGLLIFTCARLWLAGKSILEISEAMKPISRVYVHRVLTTKYPEQYETGQKRRKAERAKEAK